MKSFATSRFWHAYADLPAEVKRQAAKQYRLWQQDSRHPSLHFKQIGSLWSARVTQDYRALAILEDGDYYWFWIGTHADYERLIRSR